MREPTWEEIVEAEIELSVLRDLGYSKEEFEETEEYYLK